MIARPQYDLHCHSTFSDGTLTPPALVRRAFERGVDVLALTDHDEVGGLADAAAAAADLNLVFIAAPELSVSCRDLTVHSVGLRIDRSCPALLDGMRAIRSGRSRRG